eukprot:GHRR01031063.1.p2 GENE.GHRR01031063.1~~GHRR01031063.1.p2  ORF type:complete len:147 (-),score=31.56 GHRR01031063.1:486-926(-)
MLKAQLESINRAMQMLTLFVGATAGSPYGLVPAAASNFAVTSSLYVLPNCSIKGCSWSTLSYIPSRPPVCINSTLLPSHSVGAAAMSASRACMALPLYTGSSTTPVCSATSCSISRQHIHTCCTNASKVWQDCMLHTWAEAHNFSH